MMERNRLFQNVGGRIKGFAKAFFYIECVLGAVVAFVLFVLGCIAEITGELDGVVFLGLLVAILVGGISFLVAYIGALFWYGFGILVDHANLSSPPSDMEREDAEIATYYRNERPYAEKQEPEQLTGQSFSMFNREMTAEDALNRGRITQEEYQEIVRLKGQLEIGAISQSEFEKRQNEIIRR